MFQDNCLQVKEHFTTSSTFTKGWLVMCKCDAQKANGWPMIKIEDCRVGPHTMA